MAWPAQPSEHNSWSFVPGSSNRAPVCESAGTILQGNVSNRVWGGMVDPAQLFSNPAAAVALRVAMGGYVIYMARKFYADPTGYFRKSARNTVDLRRLEPII